MHVEIMTRRQIARQNRKIRRNLVSTISIHFGNKFHIDGLMPAKVESVVQSVYSGYWILEVELNIHVLTYAYMHTYIHSDRHNYTFHLYKHLYTHAHKPLFILIHVNSIVFVGCCREYTQRQLHI